MPGGRRGTASPASSGRGRATTILYLAEGRGWAVDGRRSTQRDDLLPPGRRLRVRGRAGAMETAGKCHGRRGEAQARQGGGLRQEPPEKTTAGRRDLGGRLPGVAQADRCRQTHYLGMVVTRRTARSWPTRGPGRPRSTTSPRSGPRHARPLDGNARRPKLVRLRGHHQWREVFSILAETAGVEVLVEQETARHPGAYHDHLRRLRDEHRRDGRAIRRAVQGRTMFPPIAR